MIGRIETPEKFLKASDDDRRLDHLEDWIKALSEDLEERQAQLKTEKNRGRKQILRGEIARLKTQLKLARREEKILNDHIWGGFSNV